MKIIRYRTEQSESTYGWVHDGKAGAILGSPFEHYRRLECVNPIERTQLLPPLIPGKIISILDNYIFQGQDKQQVTDIPRFFLKPNHPIAGPKNSVVIPAQTTDMVAQAELAVVIGKKGRWIPLKETFTHIFGYTCASTFNARDLENIDGNMHYRSRCFDTFTSLGPWIETELDPNDIVITTSLNKSLVNMTTSHEILFSIPQIITYLSSIMTLMPGDVILTGATSAGVKVNVNDFIQVEIDGIGILENTIAIEDRSRSI